MKNKFLKTTIILIIGGFLTKILGMLIKIIMTRSISTECLGLYMMLVPTLTLVISLSQFGLPTALSKLIAEENRDNKKLLFTILPIVGIINILLMLFLFLIAPILSENLLKNKDLYLGIICIALVIPFTSISSIIRSYFFGKSRALPHVIANITDCSIKLILFSYYLPMLSYKSNSYIIAFLVLSNVLSEIASIFIMMLFLPKNISFQKRDFIPKYDYLKDALSLSLPNTFSRLVGSIGFFLEPIILTSTLLFVGYSSSYITYHYGIISGYVIPLIMMPSFFTMAISQALLPAISKEYANHNVRAVKRKLKLACFLSLVIGFIATFCFISIPKLLLRFIFHTTVGVNYVRILAPLFFILYLEAPLSATLDAMGKSIDNMQISLISTIVRTLSLFILSLFAIGLWSLIISITLNILVTTYLTFKRVRYYLNE